MTRHASGPTAASRPASRLRRIASQPRAVRPGPGLQGPLTFALAAKAKRSLPADGSESHQSRLEDEHHANTNQISQKLIYTSRNKSILYFIGQIPRRLSFSRFVIANLVAIGLASVLALAAISGEPPLFDAPRNVLAQTIARIFAGS